MGFISEMRKGILANWKEKELLIAIEERFHRTEFCQKIHQGFLDAKRVSSIFINGYNLDRQ